MGYIPPPKYLDTLTQDKWECEYCKRFNVSVFENCIGCGSSFHTKKTKHINIGKMSVKEAEKVIKKWEKILK
jgi:hypothetical protein